MRQGMRRAAYAYAACRGGRAASNYENGKSDSFFHSAARRNWKNSLRFAGNGPSFRLWCRRRPSREKQFPPPAEGRKGKTLLNLFFRSVTSRGRLIRLRKEIQALSERSSYRRLSVSLLVVCLNRIGVFRSNPLPCSIHFLYFLSIARSSLSVFVVRRTFVPHYF